jgi:hypothetical protein
MDVCVRLFCVCAVYVQVAALQRADPPSKESYDCVKDLEADKAAKAKQRAVES